MDVQQSNPFQPPQADLQQATANQLPLYSVAGVGLATFIGTPLAGAWLLAHNLQLLGKADRVAMVWGISVFLLVVTLVLAFVLPEEVPAMHQSEQPRVQKMDRGNENKEAKGPERNAK